MQNMQRGAVETLQPRERVSQQLRLCRRRLLVLKVLKVLKGLNGPVDQCQV